MPTGNRDEAGRLQKKGGLRRLMALALLGGCVLAGASAGCGSSGSSSPDSDRVSLPTGRAPVLPIIDSRPSAQDGAHVEVVKWAVSGSPKGNRLPIGSEREYCAGDRPPSLIGVQID